MNILTPRALGVHIRQTTHDHAHGITKHGFLLQNVRIWKYVDT